MSGFHFSNLRLNDAFLIEYFYAGDIRGGFSKMFEKNIFEDAGIFFSITESFASISSANVLRGMHFQLTNPQSKVVSILNGSIWDVIVDLRPNSSTYKKWEGVKLSSTNHLALYVPKGFAHGFLALEDNTIMLYQCQGSYHKESDSGILFNDPDINIDWPVDVNEVIVSERDKSLMTFKEYELNPIIF